MTPIPYGRLSAMMLLQYAVWGAWLPVLGRYLRAPVSDGGLGFRPEDIGWILGLGGSVGAVCAPFIAGQLADRYYRTEHVLAVFLALGGIIKWITADQTTVVAWIVLSIAYSVVFMPTLALSNSMAFAHLTDPKAQFPRVRVWGTLGWIAASWAFPMLFLQTDLSLRWLPPFLTGNERPDVVGRLAMALKFSACLSFAYALYCLTLPATPPRRDAVDRLAFAKAGRLFGRFSFTLLVAASLAIAAIHQVYFIQTPSFLPTIGVKTSHVGPAMTIGQFAEILVMPTLGLLLATLGFRWVLTIGALSYCARFAVFGTTSLPMGWVLASQAIHGISYSCFFAAAYIYVDRLAAADVRHSAQTLFGILILGGGPIAGGWLSGALERANSSMPAALGEAGAKLPAVVSYGPLWYTLSMIGLGCAVVLALLFRDETGVAVLQEESP